MVARELMHDDTVPCHIRSRAARDLAQWSELCRQEARDTLKVLRPTDIHNDPTAR